MEFIPNNFDYISRCKLCDLVNATNDNLHQYVRAYFELVATPLLEECEDDTLPKWGLGSLSGLPKLQSSIARVKTHRLETFFMSLESY